MPELTADKLRTLATHIERALDMSNVERAAWLEVLRANDPSLAAELHGLLGDDVSQADWEGLLDDRLASILSRGEQRGADSPVRTASPRYAIGEEHARGGMGRILRARDTYLGRNVAIKELLHGDKGAEARFVREAKLTARLEHPSVVPVHDAGRWQATGKLFYSMKLISGQSLHEVASRAGSSRERLALLPNVLAVTDAVAYAHSQGIIHRDLKPANVLIGAYGETLVVDWGLAKDLATPVEAGALEASGGTGNFGQDRDAPPSATADGAVLGTPAFMPPEQARGVAVDARADVYALGAILYFVVSAKVPYDGVTAHRMIASLLKGPPARLSAREPEAPPDLCAIVDKAMAREPADRYPSAQELAQDLRRFLAGQMVTAHHYSWPELAVRWLGRHRSVAILSAIFVLTALLGTTAFVIREQGLRVLAEASRSRADSQSRALLVEHGRRELDQGRPLRAAAYLSEAYEHEPADRVTRYLVTEAARPLEAHQSTLKGHERDIVAVAFSPDGSRVATGSTDTSVRLWDSASGKALQILRGADSSIEDVAWSADGRFVASAENVVCVWDAESGILLHKLAHPGFRLRFSPDGKWLVAGSMRGWLWVWDTATWKVVLEERPHRDRISAIAFRPDGQSAVTTSWDESVTFWELPGWKPARRLEDHRNALSTAAFSADGRWLLTGDSDVTLFVRDSRQGNILRTIRLPEGSRWMSAFFSPDPRTIVTGTADGVIREWHTTSGALLQAIDAIPAGKLFDTALSPDGASVATVGLSNGDVWRLHPSSSHRILAGADPTAEVIYGARYSGDERWVVASTEGDSGARNVLHVWDARTGAEVHAWPDSGSGAKVVTNADLSRVLVSGEDGVPPRLWDALAGRVLATLDHGGRRVRSVAMSGDGALLATASDDPALRFWRGDTGALVGAPIPLDARPTALAFSPASRALAVTDATGRVRVWDVVERKILLEFQAHPTWINGIDYSADGGRLVTAGRQDHTAKLWDSRTGELRATLTGHSDNLVDATFSHDGALVATGSVDNTVRIWDSNTGELLRLIRGPGFTARFTRDDTELLTTGMNDYGVIWDARLDPRTPEQIVALVEQRSPWRLHDGRLVSRAEAR